MHKSQNSSVQIRAAKSERAAARSDVCKPSLAMAYCWLVFVLSATTAEVKADTEAFYLQPSAFPSAKFPLTVRSTQLVPVLNTSTEGQWDSVDVLNPSVVYWRGKLWSYYSGYDGLIWRTGVATSTDGLKWQKFDSNPVLSIDKQSWDSEYIAANGAAIVVGDGIYYFYEGMTDHGVTEISLAKSSDGFTFQKIPRPLIRPGTSGTWDESGVADPYVIAYDGAFYMYFVGINRAGVQRVGIAKSFDGVSWSKHPGNPILDIGATSDFDAGGLGEPSVTKIGNVFAMVYTGRNELEQRSLGVALSLDGINWRRQNHSGLPVPREGWNSEVLCDSTILLTPDGQALRVWYGGGRKRHPGKNIDGQVGYFELALPEWAYTQFDPKADWSTSLTPSTEVLKGSYPIEKDGTCWIGKEASIHLQPPLRHGVQATGYVPVSVHRKGKPKLKRLTIDFLINNAITKTTSVTDDGPFDVTVPVPKELQDQIVELAIRVSDVVNPSKAKIGDDARDLGIIIGRVRVID